MTDLPIDQSSPWFQFSTELDQVTYGLEFLWNTREGCWYVTLRDGEGNALVSGRKVTLGSLFRKYRATQGVLPLGDIYVIDTTNSGVDAAFADLGRRVILRYVTDVEMAALLG